MRSSLNDKPHSIALCTTSRGHRFAYRIIPNHEGLARLKSAIAKTIQQDKLPLSPKCAGDLILAAGKAILEISKES